MFSSNPDLYPTPDHLIAKMLSKVDFRNQKIKNILEPTGYKQNISTTNTAEIVQGYLHQGETKNIPTRYFNITFYLKGTVHLVFNDLDMLRRFNICVAKKRNWLPSDYSYTEKRDARVDFETDKEYKRTGKELAINTKNVLMLQ